MLASIGLALFLQILSLMHLIAGCNLGECSGMDLLALLDLA